MSFSFIKSVSSWHCLHSNMGIFSNIHGLCVSSSRSQVMCLYIISASSDLDIVWYIYIHWFVLCKLSNIAFRLYMITSCAILSGHIFCSVSLTKCFSMQPPICISCIGVSPIHSMWSYSWSLNIHRSMVSFISSYITCLKKSHWSREWKKLLGSFNSFLRLSICFSSSSIFLCFSMTSLS